MRASAVLSLACVAIAAFGLGYRLASLAPGAAIAAGSLAGVSSTPRTDAGAELLSRLLWRAPSSAPRPAGCATRLFDSILWVGVESRLFADNSKSLREMCASVWKSFAGHALHLVLLGAKEHRGNRHTFTSEWTWWYSYKLQALHAFLAAHQHEAPDAGARTLVVHADASDNIMFGDQLELVDCVSSLFCARGLDPARDVLIVGERGLWPPSQHYDANGYPGTGDYKYLK